MAKTVYILGAAFSKALHDSMPLCKELGTGIIEHIKTDCKELLKNISVPNKFDPMNFEDWFSYLATHQPHEDIAFWLDKQKLFNKVRNDIWNKIFTIQNTAQIEFKEFFCFIESNKSTVITFNYDTLFELGYKKHANDEGLDLTPYITESPGLSIDSNTVYEGPYLFKLHGSVNWLKIPGDELGTSVVERQTDDPLFKQMSQNNGVMSFSNGYEPLIIPPTSLKSQHYDNPFIRSLWHDGFLHLKEADEIIVIGYSFPSTDHAISNMLIQSLQNSTTKKHITIVDKDEVSGGKISEKLKSLLETHGINEHNGSNSNGKFTISVEEEFARYVADLATTNQQGGVS